MAAREIIRLAVTESTNSVALGLGRKGARAGTVVVAETQTAGRGRLNRFWLSPPGTGLYFSLITRPRLLPENLPKITLAAGLAICKTMEAEYNLAPQLKWPNDLLLHGRKFGGILTETGPLQGLPLVVIGVGLNLFAPPGGFPPQLIEHATSLSEYVTCPPVADTLLTACIESLEKSIRRLEKGDFQVVLAEWRQRDGCWGKELSWITPQGRQVTGVSLGPDADGCLRIQDAAGIIHEVISGDIHLAGKIQQ